MNVEFEEYKSKLRINQKTDLVSKVQDLNLFKSKRSAQIFLISVSILIILLAILLPKLFAPNIKNRKNDIKILPGESVGYPQGELLQEINN